MRFPLVLACLLALLSIASPAEEAGEGVPGIGYLRGGRYDPDATQPWPTTPEAFPRQREELLSRLALQAKNGCALRLYRLPDRDDAVVLTAANRNAELRSVAFVVLAGDEPRGGFRIELPGTIAPLPDEPLTRHHFVLPLAPEDLDDIRIIATDRILDRGRRIGGSRVEE